LLPKAKIRIPRPPLDSVLSPIVEKLVVPDLNNITITPTNEIEAVPNLNIFVTHLTAPTSPFSIGRTQSRKARRNRGEEKIENVQLGLSKTIEKIQGYTDVKIRLEDTDPPALLWASR